MSAGDRPGATWWVPERLEPPLVALGVGDCRGCERHLGPDGEPERGHPGLGPVPARLVLATAQPDAVVDGVVDEALRRTGSDRGRVWVTHVVKHGGPGPLTVEQVSACAPWWRAELEMLRPRGVVVVGREAARALLGACADELIPGRVTPWPGTDDRPVRRTKPWGHPDWVLVSRDAQDPAQDPAQDTDQVAELAEDLALALEAAGVATSGGGPR